MIFTVVPIVNVSAASDSTAKQELADLLEHYNTEVDYTSQYWYDYFIESSTERKNYLSAKQNAEKCLSNEATTDSQFKAASDDLQTTRYALIRSELRTLIRCFKWDFYYAPEYWYDYFTKDSYDAYILAFKKVNAVYDDENSTLEDCKSAIDEFLSVRNNLVKITPTEPIEPKNPKQELTDLLEYYSTELDYTSEKWHSPDEEPEFKDYYIAVPKAKELLENEYATDDEFESMIEELKEAKYIMIKTELEEIDNYHDGMLWSFDYTPQNWYRKYTQESYDAYLQAHYDSNTLAYYLGGFDTIEDYKYMIDKYQSAYDNLVEVHLVIGDVNFDDNINLADAILAQKGALSLIELSGNQMPCADVTEDNEVSIQDSIYIIKYSLNIPTDSNKVGQNVRSYHFP